MGPRRMAMFVMSGALILTAADRTSTQNRSIASAPLQLQARILGSGNPVILLGGGLLGADGWGGVPSLLARTHRVLNAQSLAVQYGLEGKPLPVGYELQTEVDALRALLDSTHVDVADIIGMSHGGVTGLVFALQNPRRVRTLTLIEPPAFWVLPNHGYDDPGAREMQEFVGSLRHTTITEAHVERFRCLLGDCAGGRSPRQAPQWNQWVRYRNSLRGLHTIGDYKDDPSRLRGLLIPTLVVNGAETAAFHRAINAVLIRTLPRAEALELTGGHNSAASAPDYFVAEWLRFQARTITGVTDDIVDRARVETFVDSTLGPLVDQRQTPGAVFVFVQDGHVVLAKAYGYANLERRTPVSVETTLFRLASISKSFTATAALQLVERAKLGLDDDIRRELPFPADESLGPSVTLTRLLTHTSGLDDRYVGADLQASPGRLAPWTDYVRHGFVHHLTRPGELIRYSNQNSVIAGYLIEQASGVGFCDYMRTEVLEPLGMHHSSFDQISLPLASIATGYHFQGGALNSLTPHGIGCNPASSLVATGPDLAHFITMQLNGGTYEGRPLLRPATVRLMQQPQVRMHPHFAGVSDGFWERTVNGLQTWEHAGTAPGFLSLLVLVPEKHAGLLLTHNSDNPAVLVKFVGAFFDRFYPAPPVARHAMTAAPSDLARFVGHYRSTQYPSATVDKLTLLLGGHPEFAVRLRSDGLLQLSGGPVQATLEQEEPLLFDDVRTRRAFAFRADANGLVTHLIMPYSPLEKIRFYDRYDFQASVLGLACVILLTFLLIWPIAATLRASSAKRATRWSATLILACTVSVLELTFVTIAVAAVFQLVHFDFIEGGGPFPWWVRITLAMPVAAAAVATVLVVACWRVRPGVLSGAARAHAALVGMAAAALTWVYNYWNVLGWRF